MNRSSSVCVTCSRLRIVRSRCTLTLLAAMAAWASRLPAEPDKLKAILGPPGHPWSYWSGAWAIFSLISATLLVLLARWWALSVEHTSTLNRIRAAFEANDPSLSQFLTLPRVRLRAAD